MLYYSNWCADKCVVCSRECGMLCSSVRWKTCNQSRTHELGVLLVQKPYLLAWATWLVAHLSWPNPLTAYGRPAWKRHHETSDKKKTWGFRFHAGFLQDCFWHVLFLMEVWWIFFQFFFNHQNILSNLHQICTTFSSFPKKMNLFFEATNFVLFQTDKRSIIHFPEPPK